MLLICYSFEAGASLPLHCGRMLAGAVAEKLVGMRYACRLVTSLSTLSLVSGLSQCVVVKAARTCCEH